MIRKVEILGAGPAGLYAAILLARAFPKARVRVTEQNPADATFGFGVVFSERALDFLATDDPDTHALIAPRLERWQDMTLVHPGGRITLDGIGFAAIGRLALLRLLQARAQALGVTLRHGHAVTDPATLDADLVIGADGVNSVIRRADPAAFGARLDHVDNRFAWFGAPVAFETLTQTFLTTDHGALNAHHYRYAPDRSTFIVEATADSFAAHGFAAMDAAQSAAACAAYFAETLGGARLLTNRSRWRRFPRLWCARWVSGNRVLIGDAAHTAHFSVGSGTRLALEDALALVQALRAHADLEAGLAAFQDSRPPVAKKIVDAANASALWYEAFDAKMALQPYEFAYDYVTRSGRLSRARLRRQSPRFMAAFEAAEARLSDPLGPDQGAAIGFDRAAHPNCAAMLWTNLERNPDRPAVTGPAGTLSYRALIAEAARWGNAFRAAGLTPGQRIAFVLDDTPVFPAAFFGATRAGLVPVLLNTQSPPELIDFFVADSGARLAVTDAAFLERFATGTRTGLERLVVANGQAPAGTLAAAAFLDGMPDRLAAAATRPEDMAFWMYSSGSTGRPKGIVHLHHDMAFTEAAYGRHIVQLTEKDTVFSVPKAFFAYGFGNSLTFPFAAGATSVLLPGRPDPARILDAIETYRPTVFFGLPTLYTALVRADAGRRDLSSIRLSVSAAEILSQEVFDAWAALTGQGPVEGLGSTEMLHIYLSNTPGDQRIGAAGRPVPGYDVSLRDADGNPAQGDEGVLWVRGDSSAPLYWHRPDKTAETMRGAWINTGDRFRVVDGAYHFLGRADDLIKVSGQWVWPMEVERCLNDHPLVHECAVIADTLPDRRRQLRAVVHLKAGEAGTEATAALLKEHVKRTLMPHKHPRVIDFVAALPKTGTGKIDRQALRQARKGD